MHARPVHQRIRSQATIVGVAGMCLLAMVSHGQQGRKIEFSGPRDDSVTNNLNQSTVKRSQDSFFNRLLRPKPEATKLFNPMDYDNLLAPLYRLPIPMIMVPRNRSAQNRDRMNGRDMWAEDEASGPSIERLMDLPSETMDGSLGSGSRLDRSPEGFDPTSAKNRNNLTDKTRPGEINGFPIKKELSPLEQRLNKSESALKSIFGDANGDGLMRRRDLDSGFVFQNHSGSVTPGRTAAQKARLDEYREWLDPKSSKPGGLPGNPVAGSTASRSAALAGANPLGSSSGPSALPASVRAPIAPTGPVGPSAYPPKASLDPVASEQAARQERLRKPTFSGQAITPIPRRDFKP